MARVGSIGPTTNNQEGDGYHVHRRSPTSSFVDLVVVGERIELGISNEGFIEKPTLEKKKGETNAVVIEPTFSKGKGVVSSYPTARQPTTCAIRSFSLVDVDLDPHDLQSCHPNKNLRRIAPFKPLGPLLELEAQGQGPSGWRSAQTPRLGAEYARQPSPSP
ncbi:hypothetical protein CR513_34669, partial [Mucuna pruriens]